MTRATIKMTDGTRYDDVPFDKGFDEPILTIKNNWWVVPQDNGAVFLNSNHIVSVTVKGDADDSKAIS